MSAAPRSRRGPDVTTELIEAIRSGKPLITNEKTRRLAELAAKRRFQIPPDWPKQLIEDTKDAND